MIKSYAFYSSKKTLGNHGNVLENIQKYVAMISERIT